MFSFCCSIHRLRLIDLWAVMLGYVASISNRPQLLTCSSTSEFSRQPCTVFLDILVICRKFKISLLIFSAVILSACQPSDLNNVYPSCIKPIDMAVGERVEYGGQWLGKDLSVSIEKTDETTIVVIRQLGGEKTDLIFSPEGGYCLSFEADEPTSDVEDLLIYGQLPEPGESVVSGQDYKSEDMDAGPPPVDYFQNYSCTDSGIYRTCQADFEIEDKAYHWSSTSITEDVKPGLGITAFSLQDNQLEVISIRMTEWNGI